MEKIAKKRGRPKGSKNKDRNRKEDDEKKNEVFNESIQDMATKMESFRNSILQKLKVELFGGGQNLQIPPSNIKQIISTLVNSSINTQSKSEEDVNIKENILEDKLINFKNKEQQQNLNIKNSNPPANIEQLGKPQSTVDSEEAFISTGSPKRYSLNEATSLYMNTIPRVEQNDSLPNNVYINNSAQNLNNTKSKVNDLYSRKLHETCSNQEEDQSGLNVSPALIPCTVTPPSFIPSTMHNSSAKLSNNTHDRSELLTHLNKTKHIHDQFSECSLNATGLQTTSIKHKSTSAIYSNCASHKNKTQNVSPKSVSFIERGLHSLVLTKSNHSTARNSSNNPHTHLHRPHAIQTESRASSTFSCHMGSLVLNKERLNSSFSSFCQWKAKKNKYVNAKNNFHASLSGGDFNCTKEKNDVLNSLNVNRKKKYSHVGINLTAPNAFVETGNETIKHNITNVHVPNTDMMRARGEEAIKNGSGMRLVDENKQKSSFKNKKVQCDVGTNRTLVDACSQTTPHTTTNNCTQTHSTNNGLSYIPDGKNCSPVNAMHGNIFSTINSDNITAHLSWRIEGGGDGGGCKEVEGGCGKCKRYKDKVEECEKLQEKIKCLQQEFDVLKQKLHQIEKTMPLQIRPETSQHPTTHQQQQLITTHQQKNIATNQQHPTTHQQQQLITTHQQKNIATNQQPPTIHQPNINYTHDASNPSKDHYHSNTPHTHKPPPITHNSTSGALKTSPTLNIKTTFHADLSDEDPHQTKHPQTYLNHLSTPPNKTQETFTTPRHPSLPQHQLMPNNTISISIFDSTFLNNLFLSTPIISKDLSINPTVPMQPSSTPHHTPPCNPQFNRSEHRQISSNIPPSSLKSLHSPTPLNHPHPSTSTQTASSLTTSTTSLQPLTSLPISIPLHLLCSQGDTCWGSDYDDDLYTVVEESIEDKSLDKHDLISIHDNTSCNNNNLNDNNKNGEKKPAITPKDAHEEGFANKHLTPLKIDDVTGEASGECSKRGEKSVLGSQVFPREGPNMPSSLADTTCEEASDVMKRVKLSAEDLLNCILSNQDVQMSGDVDDVTHDTSPVAGPLVLSDNAFNNFLHKVPSSSTLQHTPPCDSKNNERVSKFLASSKSHKVNVILQDFLNDDDDDDDLMRSRSKQVSRKRNRNAYMNDDVKDSTLQHVEPDVSSKNKKLKLCKDLERAKPSAACHTNKEMEESRRERKIKSPVYKKVNKCTYVGVKLTCKDEEWSRCECEAREGRVPCGDDCLNRLVYTECCPSSCPLGDRCTNQRMQRKEWQDGLEKFMTRDRGYGVRCTQAIDACKFIIEYCGEVVSEGEFRRRMVQEYGGNEHHYCLHLDTGMVIDGYRVGNISRFINHSCQPNCHMEKWKVNGMHRVGLFSLEYIPPNTELTYDYNFHSYNSDAQQVCKCGASKCRGVMGERKQKLNNNNNMMMKHKTNNDMIKNKKNNNNNLIEDTNNGGEVGVSWKGKRRQGRNLLTYLKEPLGKKDHKTRSSSFSSSSSLRSFPSFSSLKQLTSHKAEPTHMAGREGGSRQGMHPDQGYLLSKFEKSMVLRKGIFLMRNCKKVHSKKHNKAKNLKRDNIRTLVTTPSSRGTNPVKRNRTRTNNELREALRLKQEASTRQKFGLFLTKLPGFKDMFDLKVKLIKKKQQETHMKRSPGQQETHMKRSPGQQEVLTRRSPGQQEVLTRRSPGQQEVLTRKSSGQQEGQQRKKRSASEERDENLKNIFANIVCILREALEVPDHLKDHPALQLLKVNSTLPRKAVVEHPQDLQQIYNNIMLRHYNCMQTLNTHFIFLFASIQEKIGFNVEVEDVVVSMRRVYKEATKDALELYKNELEKYGLLKENQVDKWTKMKKEDLSRIGSAGGAVSLKSSSVKNGLKSFGVEKMQGVKVNKLKSNKTQEIHNTPKTHGIKTLAKNTTAIISPTATTLATIPSTTTASAVIPPTTTTFATVPPSTTASATIPLTTTAFATILPTTTASATIPSTTTTLSTAATTTTNFSTKQSNLDNSYVSSIDDDDEEEEEEDEEEIIRCVCNIYKDEGLMVQCEKCQTWQHCMCMRVKGDEERYMCELCEPRLVNKEVLLVPQPDDALLHCRYYLTLMRNEKVQVRVEECVYVSREGCDVTIDDLNLHPDLRDQLDVFRVERLWRKYNGEGCVFGHYYVRPQETFHEPHRRFFPNELFRAPIFHLVPLHAVVAPCCVLDLATYTLGRPKDISQEDVYICEYRVDKTARLFSRISRNRHLTNKASYCFLRHPRKLKPRRTVTAHELANRQKGTQ